MPLIKRQLADGSVVEEDYTPPPPAPITPDQVDAERDRRLAVGATIDVSGYGSIPVVGCERDMVIFANLRDTARDAVDAGVTDPIMPFRDADNVMHDLTPAQVMELISEARTVAQAIYAAAWALKDAPGGIPADYTADGYWT